MFGIEFIEILLFGKQMGLALTGAAALWGLVFLRYCVHEGEKHACVVYEWIIARMSTLLSIGAIITTLAWVWLLFLMPTYAHEGVTVISPLEQTYDALRLTTPLFVIWLVLTVLGLLFKKLRPKQFHTHIGTFYFLQLVFAAILISIPAWTGEFGREQIFLIGHSVHSIITVGTVLTLDFLFVISQSSVILKQHVYPLFPTISKMIWVGLGIDFLSVTLILDHIALTDKFFFMQTLIGILIINGVLLAGPITRRLIHSVQKGGRPTEKKWRLIGDVAGTISVVSWVSITFADTIKNLTPVYWQLLLTYVVVIAVLVLGRWAMQKTTLFARLLPKQ